MSQKLQPVRGTHDILPEEARRRRSIDDTLRHAAECYNFGEIQLPIFEFSDVFHRTLGDTSDVVTKETYTFTDRGGESLTLRPEFTASVVRALLSNSLQDQLPFKVFYHGPAFRYERPQKGRLRQFHQFGVELLGDPSPMADIEVIALAAQALGALGLKDKVTLEINSLGDAESRAGYRAALVDYFNGHRAFLSEDSKIRLDKNPLRILDSKDEADKKIIAGAPSAHGHFTPAAREFFDTVKSGLDALGISYRLNARLVRGLDYYSHTVFEFIDNAATGAQNTVLAGGRYDGLVKLMGGPDIPGIGWAAGIERLLAFMETAGKEMAPKVVAVIPVDDAQEKEALLLAQKLRHDGIIVELITRGNMGKKMKKAERVAGTVVILGENEVKMASATVKHLATGEQKTVPDAQLAAILKAAMD